MSGTFSGFSEEDIKNVQNGVPVNKTVDNVNKVKFGSKNNKKSVRPTVRFDESRNKINNISETFEIPEEAKLCKSEIIPQEPDKETCQEEIQHKEEPIKEQIICEEDNKAIEEVNESIQNESNVTEQKAVSLDELQKRQMLIEEQNRRRKELLTRALADKKKRTQAEVQKLNEIQNEFKKLDAVLSNDVKLLRKRIEIASITYMEAEKRYLRIEKEFLDAKLSLQQKLEKKELLTEHLCTIIEQNEQRKAEKLTELLNKLDLQDVNDIESNNKEATNPDT
ncbi:rab6-interacting protein gorab [Holotrichia oblita]|uniref:Rab6-interacting protein gorab n=1 Tax=Holotrichia oblita TaxID=644536 RepID=A0ACB9TXH1_HOLOL|nr:rab6-interacting protein gorab [Holotrichia oblita]